MAGSGLCFGCDKYPSLVYISSSTSIDMIFLIQSICRGKSFGVFNVKYTYILTVTLFETGSAICGGAPNMNALIFGRVIA